MTGQKSPSLPPPNLNESECKPTLNMLNYTKEYKGPKWQAGTLAEIQIKQASSTGHTSKGHIECRELESSCELWLLP